MNTEFNEQSNYTREYIVGAGYVLFFCLAFALCSAFYYLTYIQTRPAPVINTFATQLPPTTPIPHLLSATPPADDILFKDDFRDDSHGWARKDQTFREEVTLGKLLFESTEDGYYAFTGCALCPTLETPFYLQADFSTGAATDVGFGIIFHLNYDDGSFYLFSINTEARKYFLYHNDGEDWWLRAAGDSTLIQSFPAVNTLGLYANADTVEFYLNGSIVDSYHESGYAFQRGDFSFYVDDAHSQLILDNLVIRRVGK